ncbi:MAG: EamA family transporter RarD [Ornithinimicrobium sp.]
MSTGAPSPLTEPSADAAPPAATGEGLSVGHRASGTAYGLAAYGAWGLFPLYFTALRPAGALEILLHRVLWAFVLCLGIVVVLGQVRLLTQTLRRPRTLLTLALAGVLIAANWTLYIVAVLTGHVTEAALGYFLNPLVTVALGVVVLREQLRGAQWVAVGLGGVAAVYLTIDYGAPPWISLGLAFSFASYGLVKKHLGTSLSAIQSLTAETMILTPAALALLAFLISTGQDTFTTQGWDHALLLVGAGVATTVPLLWFAAAARRIPLSSVGLLQFLTPVLQLLCAVLVLGESVPGSRWVGFALVWVALIILSADSVVTAGRSRRRLRASVVPGP